MEDSKRLTAAFNALYKDYARLSMMLSGLEGKDSFCYYCPAYNRDSGRCGADVQVEVDGTLYTHKDYQKCPDVVLNHYLEVVDNA